MRFAAYAGTSMVLATGVVIRALHQRANFYSACVYLAQSNACLMILTNLLLLGVSTVMLGLQRLFYGPLRAIEVEQLYEKAWIAITETCLAMTIFREEVGGWFLVMFVCLLTGKVWGWIGEGRVEILEQQPPANPRLFHARLSFSLTLSVLFDMYMLFYSVETVLRQARPNMMVMFAFEFAVLTVTSLSTAARYSISLHEASVIKLQTRLHQEERRAQLRQEREEQRRQNADQVGNAEVENPSVGANEDDELGELDVDVPGWEEKGRWVFYLDLTTDFCKLILYLTFFCVLCMSYGMPIHIIRDVAITIRSFYKRITDFVRYRHATRDMNERYPDATAEEIAREDVCIICREEMRPWRRPDQPDAPAADTNRVASHSVDERLRPKKLPCGHILHFACLRSWLERQQNCPTCRRPVLVTGALARTAGQANLPELARVHAQQHRGAQAPGNGQQPNVGQNRIRTFNLGPIRLGFGAGHDVQGLQRQLNPQQPGPPVNAHPNNGAVQQLGFGLGFGRQPPAVQPPTTAQFSPTATQAQLHLIEQQLMRDINSLRLQNDQLQFVRALQGELARLRIAQANPGARVVGGQSFMNPHRTHPQHMPAMQSIPPIPPITSLHAAHAFASSQQQSAMGAGHQDLPHGMTLPEGWTVLPLQRIPSANESGLSMPSSFPPNSALDPHSLGNGSTQQSANNALPNPDFMRGQPFSPTLHANVLHPGEQSTRIINPAMNGNTADTAASTVPPVTLSHGAVAPESDETKGIKPQGSNNAHDRDGAVQSSNEPNTMSADFSDPPEVAAPASSPPISVPAWNSNDTALEDGQSSKGTNAAEVDESSDEPSSSDTISREAKGKGRAVTVEDYMDDVD
ncbi:ring finger protein [Lasallia pustulata]|uniref:RING-type E3 ubiquitin transferase n=1 Tax=Lasallia pustulata TaxID=136370 RepID=A0A1W5CUC3_9LECA|nr:ring finger protein [Lasallia pustulata]